MAALAAVTVLALVVRLWGIGWQLPWQFHPDEGHYTWKAIDLMSQDTYNPKYFRNPSLLTYLFLAEYRLLGFQPPKSDEQAATADGLWRPPSGVAFVGRLTSALMGALTVLVVGLMGWRALGAWTGVLGALFLALAFIHVRDSHYATNDVPSALLLTGSVAASLSLLRRPRLVTYLVAGLLGGLATSTKYNAGIFVVPLLVAHGITVWRAWRAPVLAASADDGAGVDAGEGAIQSSARWGDGTPGAAASSVAVRRRPDDAASRPGTRRGAMVIALVGPPVLAGAVALLAYLAGTPYTILDFPKWLADFRTQASFVDESWEGQTQLPAGVPYVLALGAGMGWAMLVAAIIGGVALARSQPSVLAVLAAFPVAYLLFMVRSDLFFVRFALPMVPLLGLLAGAGVVAVSRALDRRNVAPAGLLAVMLSLSVLAQTSLDTVRHNQLLGEDDTRVLAARWALENVGADSKMAVEEYTIRDRRPRAYGGPAWQIDTDVLDVNELRRADPTEPLRGTTRYFMLSSFQGDRFTGGPDAPQRRFYEALAQEGQVVARFSPSTDGTPIPFDLEDLYSPFWLLDRYERPGPTITVYEMPGRP